MANVEEIEEQIRCLSPEDLVRICEFVRELDWEIWDREIEADANAGRLDALAHEAMEEYRAGRTRRL